MYICIPSQLKDCMMHVHVWANGRVGTYIRVFAMKLSVITAAVLASDRVHATRSCNCGSQTIELT